MNQLSRIQRLRAISFRYRVNVCCQLIQTVLQRNLNTTRGIFSFKMSLV